MWFILNILRFGRRHTKKRWKEKRLHTISNGWGYKKENAVFILCVCLYVSFNIYIFCHEYFNVVWISLSFLCVYVWHLMPFAHLFHRQHLTVVVAKCIKKNIWKAWDEKSENHNRNIYNFNDNKQRIAQSKIMKKKWNEKKRFIWMCISVCSGQICVYQ